MLGFRGHFSTKSRRYSITLGRLRRARRRFQTLLAEADRNGQRLDTRDLEARLLAEDDDTTLVVGSWSFAGTGWNTDGDTALALPRLPGHASTPEPRRPEACRECVVSRHIEGEWWWWMEKSRRSACGACRTLPSTWGCRSDGVLVAWGRQGAAWAPRWETASVQA